MCTALLWTAISMILAILFRALAMPATGFLEPNNWDIVPIQAKNARSVRGAHGLLAFSLRSCSAKSVCGTNESQTLFFAAVFSECCWRKRRATAKKTNDRGNRALNWRLQRAPMRMSKHRAGCPPFCGIWQNKTGMLRGNNPPSHKFVQMEGTCFSGAPGRFE